MYDCRAGWGCNMLAPIPRQILTDSMTLFVPTGIDVYQNPTGDTYTVANVHLQNTNEIRRTATNSEVVLRSLLFVDARQSSPSLDYVALARAAQAVGAQMTTTMNGVLYTVKTVDAVPDDTGKTHHWELGLV